MIRFAAFALVTAFIVSGAAVPAQETTTALRLVPQPREVKVGDGFTSVTRRWKVEFSADNAEDAATAALLIAEARQSLGARLTTAPLSADGVTTRVIALREVPAAADDAPLFKTQGYRLTIGADRVEIAAPTAVGRFYGVQTLRQIMRGADKQGLPHADVTDYPALEWRGISDDVSRGQVSTISDFRHVIRQLAYYKMNLYQPYIEDMFEFDTNPNIGRERGAITKAEFREMVEEGRRNHVVVAPIFETLGHQDRLLSLPENRRYAEVTDPEVTPWSFAPASAEARAFVKKLMDEIAELSPGPFFHIGGDETYDVGRGQSKKLVEKEGSAIVQARYFAEMADHLREKHGLRTLMYGDMLSSTPKAFKELPDDAILIDWHYSGTDYPTTAKMKEAGVRDFFVSPGIWGWGTFHVALRRGFNNIAGFAKVGKAQGAMGCITSSWGDDGAENLRENNMPGYAYGAAASWQTGEPKSDAFMRDYVVAQYGADLPELASAELELGSQSFPDRNVGHQVYHSPVKLNERSAKWLERMDQLKSDMTRVRRQLAAARKQVRHNARRLDALDHGARRFLFVAERDSGLTRVAQMLGSKASDELPLAEQREARKVLTHLRDEAVGIAAEYEKLWLRSNKYPMLQDVMARLDGQVADLQRMVVRLDAGELTRAPQPHGAFIWHPDDADPFTTTVEGMTYFMRAIKVEKPVKSVEIHAWGDDRVTVYVQGKRPARRVCSSGYNDVACEWINAPGFKVGENLVSMAVENRFGAGTAFMTVIIRYEDNTTETITGDDQWRVMRPAKEMPKGWNTRKPSGKEWKRARVLGNAPLAPWTVMEW